MVLTELRAVGTINVFRSAYSCADRITVGKCNALDLLFLPRRRRARARRGQSQRRGIYWASGGHCYPVLAGVISFRYILQKDHAISHTVRATQGFLADSNVGFLAWSGSSPDLNLIENLQLLAREVYKDCSRFGSVKSLAAAMAESYEQIILKLASNLRAPRNDAA